MGIDHIIEKIHTGLGDRVQALECTSGRRAYARIGPDDVPEASRLLFRDMGARFQIATGVDTRAGIEVMYHWALDSDDCLVTVRTLLDRERPVVDSIAPLCPAAEWIEREMWELLGIEFRGHPDLRHLLLDDDWPEGDYPLRRTHEARP